MICAICDGAASLGRVRPVRWIWRSGLLAACVGLLTAASAGASTFSNTAPILVPACLEGDCSGAGRAEPYPSTISVEGLPGTVAKATVTLDRVFHNTPDEIDALLVGPGAQKVLLISDACGLGTTPLTGQILTFDDAGSSLPNSGPCTRGTYRPTNYAGLPDSFDAPAPSPPYGPSLSDLNGGPPNGVWRLFVFDNGPGGEGNQPITGGWSLELLPMAQCAGATATRAPSVGTAGDDVLTGTQSADVMLGLGGNDTILGQGGRDVVCGGIGNDKLLGGLGKDSLLGEAGRDILKGGLGKDICKGGVGKDKANKTCETRKTL
jgi:RTX calcium-binding nonapeptide repeat (4 copies)